MADTPTSVAVPSRVLVVEDSPSDRRLLIEALREIGVDTDGVTAVGTLAEARAALSVDGADCILLDLSLPDAGGLDAVMVMAAAAPGTPVVVVTGRPADSLVYAAMAQGADELLSKADLTPDRLRDALCRASQRRLGRMSAKQAASGAAFDALDSPTATLDGSGRITAVNIAWSAAAAERGGRPETTGVGVSYLGVCDRAVGRRSAGAAEAAAGIRRVLQGEVDHFTMDYECSSATAPHWFNLRVTPLGPTGGGAVVTHLDITPLVSAEQDARRDLGLLRGLLHEGSPIFALVDPDGVVLEVSDTTTRLLGLQRHQEVGASAFQRIDPSDRDWAMASLARVAALPGATERLVLRVVDGQGRRRELDVSLTNLLEDPRVGALAVTGSDVTEGRRHMIASRLEAKLLQRLPAAVIVTDDQGVVVYWNDLATRLYGFDREAAVGRVVTDLNVGPSGEEVARTVMRAVLATGRWEGDYDARTANGAVLPVHTILERIDDEEIGFHGIVGASIDISERRRLEEDLAFQALYDGLTGLPNRRLLVDHIDGALARSRRNGRGTGVLYVDIDDFKAVNDERGPTVGDAVLREVAARLEAELPAGNLAARIGGDEFVVCFDDLVDLSSVYDLGERIGRRLAEPIDVDGAMVAVTASIGMALAGADSIAEGLLRNADAAMYEAKDRGRNRIELFDDATHHQVRREHEAAARLEQALDAGQIQPFFQPQISLPTGELMGFEALARWVHPVDGVIPPDAFIPLAERSGLIGRLGRVMLRSSCEALVTWREANGARPITVAVNASVHQLSQERFVDDVREILADTGAPPSGLSIEVTESALADPEVAAEALHRLKALGVRVALDDFGTGYSSLSWLRTFSMDYLKIDRSFVDGMTERSEDRLIVTAVIGLAESLGLEVIAEGVERQDQLDELCRLGCDIGQGFLWSPAVPARAALVMAARTDPWLGCSSPDHVP